VRVKRRAARVRGSEVGLVDGGRGGRGGKRIGVLGLDLGGTSGLAWWTGEVARGSLKECLLGGEFGFTQIGCGNGSVHGERAGAEAISEVWRDLDFKWTLAGIAVGDRAMAMEDFILRPKVGSTARVGLASARLAGLVEGMCVRIVAADQIVRYSPSRSKSFANSDRLRLWGLWCRSMPHARDAAKQVAIHVATVHEGVQ
jgi:hypothetical protein